MNVIVRQVNLTPIAEQKLEIVERKGVGHPDSLADGISEAISKALCREYLRRFGKILHHNTDQVQVVGGRAKPEFGGGELLKPIFILLSGRATAKVGDEHIPVHKIAIKAAKEYLDDSIRNLDVNHHVVIDSRIGQGSADLVSVYEKGETVPLANDTSFGVSFAPLTETEKIVLETEKYLNSRKFKKKLPAVGEDIKVMGLRRGNKITLTIAAAIIDREVDNASDYDAIKQEIVECAADLVTKITDKDVEIHVNTADDYRKGIYYLTVTGTSAEHGDDGSTGRGNRVNGLITPYRPMSLEAAAGKNPVSHVGKIYNVLARLIAEDIVREIEAKEVYVHLLSQIGKPINKPLVADVQIIGVKGNGVENKVKDIVGYWLENVTSITRKIVEDEIGVF